MNKTFLKYLFLIVILFIILIIIFMKEKKYKEGLTPTTSITQSQTQADQSGMLDEELSGNKYDYMFRLASSSAKYDLESVKEIDLIVKEIEKLNEIERKKGNSDIIYVPQGLPKAFIQFINGLSGISENTSINTDEEDIQIPSSSTETAEQLGIREQQEKNNKSLVNWFIGTIRNLMNEKMRQKIAEEKEIEKKKKLDNSQPVYCLDYNNNCKEFPKEYCYNNNKPTYLTYENCTNANKQIDISNSSVSNQISNISNQFNNIIVQQSSMLKNNLDVSNEQLDAFNESLDVFNEQLDVSNEQLDVSNEQLDVSNENLDISNQVSLSNKKFKNYKFKIDRIKTPNNKYMYCLGGNLECPENSRLQKIDDLQYNSRYQENIGNTYESKCYDISNNVATKNNVMCKNSIFEKKKSYTFSSSCNDEDKINVVIESNSNDEFSNFTKNYNYIPLSVDSDFVYLYKEDGELNFKADPCYLQGNPELCCENKNEFNIKCSANFGSKIGDPLCCEQEGVVQNTKFICPSELPTCIGYKCGETWGKCVK